MKPRRESTENGDFSDPKGEFKIDFWGGIVSKYIPVRKSIFEPKKRGYRRS
jgi:hypothetical protein